MLAEALKQLFESMGVRVVDITPHPHDEDRARMADMSDDDVKRLWDAYDGCNSPDGISGEAIHFELNMRGQGRYCAV
jgi:hypothetical protein